MKLPVILILSFLCSISAQAGILQDLSELNEVVEILSNERSSTSRKIDRTLDKLEDRQKRIEREEKRRQRELERERKRQQRALEKSKVE